jgi:two-component system NtrC family sensor kinase
MAERTRPYRRLRRQMLTVVMAVGLVPLAAMAAASLVTFEREFDSRTRAALEAMVKNRTATINLFLEEKRRQLELCAAALAAAELGRPPVLETLRQELGRERGGIIDLGLIGADGRHLAYVGPYDLAARDYRDAPWFREVMVRGHYESDVFLGFRRFPHMVMAVKKREGGRDFVLRATLDTDRLSALVREGGLESGADVFVLNRRGEYQTQYSPDHRLMERADLGAVPPHSGVRVTRATRGGREEHVATAWLRGDAWVLVARQAAPGPWAIVRAEPALLWVPALILLALPLLAVLVARRRLQQIRELEAERAMLIESAAQGQKMAAIGRMAASVAHEINNPLAIIDAQVGVLRDALGDGGAAPDGAELRQRLGTIAAQVQRGRKVTHGLLGFSRRVGPSLEPVDVQAALDETVGFVEQAGGAARVRVVRHYAPDVPLIRSSLARMQQVFLNLINNALDAVGDAGEVHLQVGRAGDGVEVQIRDNGPGIPARDLARIFEPFFSTKTGAASHGGLGLSICQDLMRVLDGRISVSSTVGQGTTFTLWFPPEVAAEEVSRASARAPGR